MRRAAPFAALATVAALAGCGSGTDTSKLVGMPASQAICQLAKQGLSYRIGSGPVVKPTQDIACRTVDGPQPHVVRAKRSKQLVVMRATCPATVGCL